MKKLLVFLLLFLGGCYEAQYQPQPSFDQQIQNDLQQNEARWQQQMQINELREINENLRRLNRR